MTFSSKQRGLYILLGILCLMAGAGYWVGRTTGSASTHVDAAASAKAHADRQSELAAKYTKEATEHAAAAHQAQERARAIIQPRQLVAPAAPVTDRVPVVISGGKPESSTLAPALGANAQPAPAPVSAREFD